MEAALKSFQQAYSKGYIAPTRCKLRPDLWVLRDDANGDSRLTFTQIDDKGTVRALVSLLPAEPYEGKPCFALAYAVAEKFRGIGLAQEIVESSIVELHNGLKQQVPQFYIEVVVDKLNTASNRVAAKVISSNPVEITDQFSGDPALQYFRLVGK
ncbi:hypothetical protein SAMN05216204_10720 [Massilia yuzhufengensis]|uniref:N-acetyltransferase domain-containing protein n=2 Tax=Massilia yuzhufengensis TaxID=1164594 RepID=A0A1I1K0F2_9BURK|nr:hypothetical protein SAMN05216204_10720 [Massilia yuzhufengensis]